MKNTDKKSPSVDKNVAVPDVDRASLNNRWTDRLSEQELALLADRTQKLAKVQQDQVEEEALVPYVHFRLGANEHYGIPQSYVDEIVYYEKLSSVPSTPAFIAGVTDRRGEMLTVLDLRFFFQANETDLDGDARIMAVRGAGLTVGLLANAVDGNDAFNQGKLSLPLPSGKVSNLAYVKGIHKGSVTILDLEVLLRDPVIRVGEH